MKLFEMKTFLWVGLLIASLAGATSVSAQIYKSVDKDGTVTYSDKPPTKDAKPIKLPPISVVEAPEYAETTKPAAAKAESDSGFSLGTLRSSYKDFAIIAPKQDESIWHPQGPVTAAWKTHYKLQPGMQVTMVLDGKKQPPTNAQIIPLGNLDRGEHNLQAILTDAQQRQIASTPTVTFYVHRPSIYSPARAGQPNNGG